MDKLQKKMNKLYVEARKQLNLNENIKNKGLDEAEEINQEIFTSMTIDYENQKVNIFFSVPQSRQNELPTIQKFIDSNKDEDFEYIIRTKEIINFE